MPDSITFKESITFEAVKDLVFQGAQGREIELPKAWKEKVASSHRAFLTRFEQREPIYGVTTGFGDSSFRRVDLERSQQLQENLIRYLSCGTGPVLRRPVRRAICLFRLLSLARGLSGVSDELIQSMTKLVENDWLPLIPAEGSWERAGISFPSPIWREVSKVGEMPRRLKEWRRRAICSLERERSRIACNLKKAWLWSMGLPR